MTFKKTELDRANGTTYQGLIKIKYPELCSIFGKPELESEDENIQACWTIEVAGAVIVTIYDYKENQPARELMLWHVGGFSKDSVQLLEIIIKEYRKANK